MDIEYTDFYTNSGCTFRGNLGVIHHSKHWNDSNRANGGFASMDPYDKLKEAELIMNQYHPGAKVLLSIPDLVFEIQQND